MTMPLTDKQRMHIALSEDIRYSRQRDRSSIRGGYDYVGEMMRDAERVFSAGGYPIPDEYKQRIEQHRRTPAV